MAKNTDRDEEEKRLQEKERVEVVELDNRRESKPKLCGGLMTLHVGKWNRPIKGQEESLKELKEIAKRRDEAKRQDEDRCAGTDWWKSGVAGKAAEAPGDPAGGSNPGQYGLPAGATDLQDLIEHRKMNFALGNIFKAVYRLGVCNHSDALRDLNKIVWFTRREIKRLENRK